MDSRASTYNTGHRGRGAGLQPRPSAVHHSRRRTATAALKAANDTARAALDANRQWIDFDVDSMDPWIQSLVLVEIKVIVKMRNLGNSPAAWTDVFAFVDRMARNSQPVFNGLRGTSVFQNGTADRTLNARLLDFQTRSQFGETNLVLRVCVEYPLPGNPELGATVRCWEIQGPFIGGVNLRTI